MEKQVIFRDYQEQQAQDHNDLQSFARTSFDHIVLDAVTETRRYAGFAVSKTAQTEIQVQPGRFYDIVGAIYNRNTILTQSMVAYLPAVAKRIMALTVYGTESETDVEERDFLKDADTGRTEPDSVPTTSSRDAVLTIVTGTESADPQPPAIPVANVAIAYILCDPTQILSVTMLTDNEVSSTEDLGERLGDVEEFDAQIGPRVSSLASDLAALANKVKTLGGNYDIGRIYEDMARVKERVEIPATASDYGADRFLDKDDSDSTNALQQGYDAMVEEGSRFPWANEDVFEPNIFSANDPNAHVTGGLLLPAFDDILKLEIGTYHEDLGIAQYGFTDHDIVHKQIARQRLRYGDWFTVCTNANWWQSGTYDPITNVFLKAGEEYDVQNIEHENIENHGLTHWVRVRQIWRDNYVEDYWDVVTIETVISGAQIAQSVLVPNDMWLTKIGFYMTTKAANEAVYVTLCKLTAGVPDLAKAILHQQIPHTSLVVGDWTEVDVMPTFLKGGERFALVFTSNANHKFGMAFGQQYLDGTFFYSTDTVYYLGDLTKDLMIRLYGAKFRAPQVTVELTALNLDGGIRNIDILAGMIIPGSTKLIFEVQPEGSGAWIPLDESNLTAFDNTPPLVRFRARFVGTRDMQAGLMLTGSEVKLFRSKTAFKHVSIMQTLAGPSSEIHVKVLLEEFDDVPHDLTCKLVYGSPLAEHSPTTTTTVELNATDGRYSREFKFEPNPAISTFSVVMTGTTNSASDTFHVAERIYWSI